MKDQGGDNDEDNNDDDDNDGDDDDGDGDDDNSAKDDGGTDEGGNDEEESYSPADILSLSFTRFKIVRSNCYGVHVSGLDFSSLCCATGYYGLRVLVVVMIYLRRCSIGLYVFYIYRSRNILGGVAQSDREFDLRGMLRPYFWIKSGN